MNYNMARDTYDGIMHLKKNIQDYWTKNVPYLDRVSSKCIIGSERFYLEADLCRRRYEPYTLQLVKFSSKNSGRMLEVGCGLGSDLRSFSKAGMDVLGIDLSSDNTRLEKRGFKVLNLKGETLCADAENLPFKSESFDLVYSFGVFHHTPNTQRAIDEAYRVLKAGGKSVIMVYHKGLAYYYISALHLLKKLSGERVSEENFISEKYDHTPLSKMYSKKEARVIFSKFKNVKINIVTFGGIRANKILWWVYYLLNIFPFLMNRFGSFLIIQGDK